MKHSYRWTFVMPFTVALLLPACGQQSEPQSKSEPAHVEHVEGSEFPRVVLTPRAAERIGIATVPVREQARDGQLARADMSKSGAAEAASASAPTTAEKAEFATLTAAVSATEPPLSRGTQTVVPYSAVLYDARGGTWVYTSPEPLVFVRHPIRIESIEGDQAVLSEGPSVGMAVVAVGVAEVYGTEFEVGH